MFARMILLNVCLLFMFNVVVHPHVSDEWGQQATQNAPSDAAENTPDEETSKCPQLEELFFSAGSHSARPDVKTLSLAHAYSGVPLKVESSPPYRPPIV